MCSPVCQFMQKFGLEAGLGLVHQSPDIKGLAVVFSCPGVVVKGTLPDSERRISELQFRSSESVTAL